MELVGLGYSGWFVYRYLLFKVKIEIEINFLKFYFLIKFFFVIFNFLTSCPCYSQESRKELANDIEALKKKIAGTGE